MLTDGRDGFSHRVPVSPGQAFLVLIGTIFLQLSATLTGGRDTSLQKAKARCGQAASLCLPGTENVPTGMSSMRRTVQGQQPELCCLNIRDVVTESKCEPSLRSKAPLRAPFLPLTHESRRKKPLLCHQDGHQLSKVTPIKWTLHTEVRHCHSHQKLRPAVFLSGESMR